MIILVLVLVLLCFFGARLLVGYPRPQANVEILSAGEVAFVEAAAHCFVPRARGPLVRGGGEVALASYVDVYLTHLPEEKRRLLRALFILFEQGTVIFPARGVGGFRRFSSLTLGQQSQVLEGWAKSRIYFRRSLLAALKAVVLLGVVGHSENLQGLGLTPFTFESPIIESDLLYPTIGSSRDSIDLSEDDLTVVRESLPLDQTPGSR